MQITLYISYSSTFTSSSLRMYAADHPDYEDEDITKVETAKRMKPSRAELDRLLEATNGKVQLDKVQPAAVAGRRLQMYR